MEEDLRIVRAGWERIDELRSLWCSLQEHHVGVAPTLGGLPARSPEESWKWRRRKYAAALKEPDAFVMIAERAGASVGYALVSLAEGPSGWDYGERTADVETLSVAPAVRGQGVGTRLMDAVEQELRRIGIRAFRVLVIAANADARRFYEGRGLIPISQVLLGRVGG